MFDSVLCTHAQVGVADRYTCLLTGVTSFVPPQGAGAGGSGQFHFIVSNPPYIPQVLLRPITTSKYICIHYIIKPLVQLSLLLDQLSI
jgi:tRNA1(Val) A37 N6-methylase TrmN6